MLCVSEDGADTEAGDDDDDDDDDDYDGSDLRRPRGRVTARQNGEKIKRNSFKEHKRNDKTRIQRAPTPR